MPSAQHANPDAAGYSYARALADDLHGAAKAARTAQQIRIASCVLLDRSAPADLTIAAICREAGIATGTFYLHFPDQAHLLDDLLPGFARFLQAGMIGAARARPDDAVRAATEAYAGLFAANRGLMKCLIHHLDAFPAARATFHRLNREWIEIVVAGVRRRLRREGQLDAITEAELTRRAYALGGMTDQYLSGLYLSGEPGLVAVSRDLGAVIDSLTTIWERGLQP